MKNKQRKIRKIYTIIILFLVTLYSAYTDVKAADNLKSQKTNDADTKTDKCPTKVILQDNLKGDKEMDFSLLDCMYYQMDEKGNFILDENGEKVLRKKEDDVNFSCVQKFLDSYTNEEFKEAANGNTAEGFVTNKYCPVYCVEANEFKFPGYAPVTNSGAHFNWTIGKDNSQNILEGLTVRLHGTKACRTQVDLAAWIDDYKDIMKKIEDLIDVKSPTGGTGQCVNPSAPSNDGAEVVGCGFKPNVKTLYYKISSADFEVFSAFSSLEDLAGSNRYADIAKNIIDEATGMTASLDDAIGFGNLFEESTGNVAESNRYYITSAKVNISETPNGIIMLYSDGDGTATSYDISKPNNYDTLNRWLAQHASRQEGSTIITIRVDVHELHCCGWVRTNASGADQWASNSSGMYLISNGIPVSGTKGFKPTKTASACGTLSGGAYLVYPTVTHGISCCGDVYPTYSRKWYCSADNSLNSATCIDKYGPRAWVFVSKPDGYACSRDPQPFSYYEEYHIKCGIGQSGTDQATAASGTRGCTPSSVPRCPSGYSYSPSTGKCYYANISEIYKRLNQLLGMAKDLKACQEVINNYEYYLDTEMEVEYNETSDSDKNFYFPNKDANTTTKLTKVTKNDNANGNKLGEYNSELIKPSEKSNVGGVVNFFGKNYTFGKDGIPFVNCALAGATKTCFAINNTSLNDYWYDWYGKVYVAMYEYRLDGKFYKWVKLPSGESMSTAPVGDYLKYGRFIDIGYANYPVHYATPGGEYEGLNIKITNIGYKNYLYNTYRTAVKNYNNSLTDRDLVSTEEQNQLLHDCYYQVEEGEPYCPTTGCGKDEYELGSVRIIYRPISLENPFPSMDGDGRNTGNNWCILNDDKDDCSNTNDNVTKYILNNRNTEGSSIYFEREPMYQITLNPALIKQIRNYNSRTNYDDYNLSCSTVAGEEGSECRSHFVVGGMEETSLPSLKDYISGCGTDNDWYACDKLDNYER